MVWFDRGKQKLIEGRHVFNRDKEVKGKLYWKCEDRDFAARIHSHCRNPLRKSKGWVSAVRDEGASNKHSGTDRAVDSFYVAWAEMLTVDKMKRVLRRTRQHAGVRKLDEVSDDELWWILYAVLSRRNSHLHCRSRPPGACTTLIRVFYSYDFALFPGKKQELYNKMLNGVLNHISDNIFWERSK